MKQKIETTVIAYLFIFPSLLGIVVFYIVPYIICLIKSLYAGQEFVGLKNYIQLFSNNTFLFSIEAIGSISSSNKDGISSIIGLNWNEKTKKYSFNMGL